MNASPPGAAASAADGVVHHQRGPAASTFQMNVCVVRALEVVR